MLQAIYLKKRFWFGSLIRMVSRIFGSYTPEPQRYAGRPASTPAANNQPVPVHFGHAVDTFTKAEQSPSNVKTSMDEKNTSPDEAPLGRALQEKQARKTDDQARQLLAKQLEEEQKSKEEMKFSTVVEPFRDMNIKNRIYRDGEKVTTTITKGFRIIARFVREILGKWIPLKPEEPEKMKLPPGRTLRK
jgi:hypothetical protein